jgi:hypothetical protein
VCEQVLLPDSSVPRSRDATRIPAADDELMRMQFACLTALCAALLFPTVASAALEIGVVDDAPKGTLDGGATFYELMADLGMKENRVTMLWDPERDPALEDALTQPIVTTAALRGIRVVFAVFPAKARAITSSPSAGGEFTAYLQHLARTYPTVKDYIIGNEPNQTRFWQPQFSANGRGAACAAYQTLLAASYDALKAVDPAITVIGVGLSPRGNDNPRAASNVSTSPVRCIRDMGRAYRASKRKRPLMDELSFHPYPKSDRDPLMRGYSWPNAGIPNLNRIKQAFWDAFRGTAQPTFPEGRSTRGLRFRLDEVGWQVGVLPGLESHYFGRETVETTNEAAQAEVYGSLVPFLACDPSVRSVLFFGLRDEPDLDRWQAGLLRAEGSPRPAYARVKAVMAATGGRCTGRERVWRHATSVIGAGARFSGLSKPKPLANRHWAFKTTADEEAIYRAGIFRAPTSRAQIARALARGRGVLSKSGVVNAHWTPLVKFPGKKLKRGSYVYAIELRAAMNPARKSLFISRAFRVGFART